MDTGDVESPHEAYSHQGTCHSHMVPCRTVVGNSSLGWRRKLELSALLPLLGEGQQQAGMFDRKVLPFDSFWR